MATKAVGTKKKGLFNGFLDFIEKVGNKLPHPATLFLILAIMVIIISAIAAAAGASVSYEVMDKGQLVTRTVDAKSLMSKDGIRFIFSDAIKNFTGFPPLGVVLVAMLGVGLAEGTGLIQTTLRKMVLSTPKRLITAMVVFAGVMSNIASDAGYVVLIPLGAIVFLSFKRHPLAGMAAAFAGVSGGFSANLAIGSLDPMLATISQDAAQLFAPGTVVNPTDNYYFMAVSTILITLLGTWITEKLIEPRLGKYDGEAQLDSNLTTITPQEKKGLRWAGISLLIYVALIVIALIPSASPLRADNGDIIKGSSFMAGIVPLIAWMFLIPGIVYGVVVGTIKNDKDVANVMGKAMATMGGYLVLAFFAAQFVSYFTWSGMGTILAVKGADFLVATNMTGLPMIIGFILVAAFINLFIGSASAKWTMMAPIFVPMLMKIGYSPAFTQLAYRIGDSTTNIITPLMSYFAIIVAFAQKYDKKAGIGTLISMMIPFSMIFLGGWTLLLVVWFLAGLPIGPGAGVFF